MKGLVPLVHDSVPYENFSNCPPKLFTADLFLFYFIFYPQTGCDRWLCIAVNYGISKALINPRKSPQHHPRFHVLVHSLNCVQWHASSPRPPPFCFLFRLGDFPLFAPATSSCGRSPRSGFPESLLRKRRRPGRSGPSPYLAQQGQGPSRRRWSEDFSAGFAVQARLAAPCFPSGFSWIICIKNVCSEIILLAVRYCFRPCLVVFVLVFCLACKYF